MVVVMFEGEEEKEMKRISVWDVVLLKVMNAVIGCGKR